MTNDPRGPERKIVKVEPDPNGGATRVTLDCGHVREFNQIYHYELGSRSRCLTCGKIVDGGFERASERAMRLAAQDPNWNRD